MKTLLCRDPLKNVLAFPSRRESDHFICWKGLFPPLPTPALPPPPASLPHILLLYATSVKRVPSRSVPEPRGRAGSLSVPGGSRGRGAAPAALAGPCGAVCARRVLNRSGLQRRPEPSRPRPGARSGGRRRRGRGGWGEPAVTPRRPPEEPAHKAKPRPWKRS